MREKVPPLCLWFFFSEFAQIGFSFDSMRQGHSLERDNFKFANFLHRI